MKDLKDIVNNKSQNTKVYTKDDHLAHKPKQEFNVDDNDIFGEQLQKELTSNIANNITNNSANANNSKNNTNNNNNNSINSKNTDNSNGNRPNNEGQILNFSDLSKPSEISLNIEEKMLISNLTNKNNITAKTKRTIKNSPLKSMKSQFDVISSDSSSECNDNYHTKSKNYMDYKEFMKKFSKVPKSKKTFSNVSSSSIPSAVLTDQANIEKTSEKSNKNSEFSTEKKVLPLHLNRNFVEKEELDVCITSIGGKPKKHSESCTNLKLDNNNQKFQLQFQQKIKNQFYPKSKFNQDEEEFDNYTNTEEIKDFNQYNKDCLEKIAKIALNPVDVIYPFTNYKLDKSKYKKLVIFDLDETLIHCQKTDVSMADHTITVNLPSGKTTKVGINIRPHVFECLKKLKEESKYDIICFTASSSFYANPVLDILDKNYEIFSLRLFRENCISYVLDDSFIYIKDLRIFKNVSLNDLLIVDNSLISFAFHLDNGIPILPFYNNKKDNELVYLISYLDSIVNSYDLRKENKRFIKYNYESLDNNLISSTSIRSIIFESSLELIELSNKLISSSYDQNVKNNSNYSTTNDTDEKSNFSLKNLFLN